MDAPDAGESVSMQQVQLASARTRIQELEQEVKQLKTEAGALQTQVSAHQSPHRWLTCSCCLHVASEQLRARFQAPCHVARGLLL